MNEDDILDSIAGDSVSNPVYDYGGDYITESNPVYDNSGVGEEIYDYGPDPATIAAIAASPPATLYDPVTKQMASAGSPLYKSITDRYTPAGGAINWGNILGDGLMGAAAITAFNQASNPRPTGYQGGIPKYTSVRGQLPTSNPAGLPGAGGQRYFTDTTFANNAAGATGLDAARAAALTQGTELNAQNQARAAASQPAPAMTPAQSQAASDKFYGRVPAPAPVRAAQGGLMGLAAGGKPAHGRYLQGSTDGMADKLPARIDHGQEAALSHGEFVIPADVVSHLGNGNSDAGAKQLYKMMDNIRQARTGNKKQGKEINPNKFTPGGLAGYAAGGVVSFLAGGATTPPTGATGMESNLSTWAGPYVTDMLAKGQALSEQPYQAYQGPLSAGASDLQQTGFQNAANLSVPTSIGAAANTAADVGAKYGAIGPYNGTQTTAQTFGAKEAEQYMNPYLQQSLDPQLAEARRQSEITQQGNAAKMTQAGAFGGGRSAILQGENQRALGTNLASITGQGYNTAYTNAQNQFNADQGRSMQAQAANVGQQQFGATQGLNALAGELSAANTAGNLGVAQNTAGLSNLNTQLAAGATQRDITQQGVAADKTAFEAERDNPYKMVQYQQSLLQGLPLNAQSYNITNNPIAAAAQAAGGINAIVNPAPAVR